MSVHSEIQNVLGNHSGDAALSIHGRQGDSEEGNSFFDMRAAGDQAPDEQDRARIAFLRRYFAILRETLSPEEFKFFKLKFQTKKPEKLVAAWCGVSQRRIFQKMRDKIQERKDEIEALIDESEWENAERFANTALMSASELSRGELPEDDIDDPQGDFDEVKKAQKLLAIRKELYKARYDEHKAYTKGWEAGRRYSFRKMPDKIRRINIYISHTIFIFLLIEDMIDRGKDTEAIKTFIETQLPFFQALSFDRERIAGA